MNISLNKHSNERWQSTTILVWFRYLWNNVKVKLPCNCQHTTPLMYIVCKVQWNENDGEILSKGSDTVLETDHLRLGLSGLNYIAGDNNWQFLSIMQGM